MNLAKFGDPTALMVAAFKCDAAGCTRAYNSSMGYFDIVNDQFQLLEKEQQDCHRDETPMFLESIAGDTEIWRCGQRDCDYSQNFKHQPQY
jgi:hypothetical protein